MTNKIIQLAAGDAHTCLLTANGRVKCWGSNSHNQLGSRTISVNIGDDEAPSAFGFLNIGETVKQIAAAGDQTCALMETGKLKCWGRNDFGQLGLGNTTTLTTAIKLHPYVDVGEDVKSVSAGRNSTCVVTVTGQVKCWGLNDAGQLGQGNLLTLGDDEAVSTIQSISLGTSPAISVQVGDKHACAVLEDKSVACWGSGSSGRLGYSNTNSIGDNELPNSAGFLQGLSQEGIKYDEQDRLLAFGTKIFTYNPNGDLLTETDSLTGITKTFEYDVFGNLKKVFLPSKTINYKVDAHNRRIAKIEGTSAVEYYMWNDNSQLIGVADSSGALVTRFVYGSKSHSPDYMVKSGVNYQIVSNHLGSPVAVIDGSTGNVTQEISYDEFGNILSDSSPGLIPFGYAGCLFDLDTKLCKFGARNYDSSIGRWISKDPIRFKGRDSNLYGYVRQDPINLIDPSGLDPGDKFGTEAEAGFDALNYINAKSIIENREYAGNIYKNVDGTYSYTPPRPGTVDESRPGPFTERTTAFYHTHGNSLDDYHNDDFSPEDEQLARLTGFNSYLATPAKGYMVQDGFTGLIKKLVIPFECNK